MNTLTNLSNAEMQIVTRKVNELKPVAWNPEIRVSEKKIGKLRDSIEENGLMTPILIDQDNNIIDGTRRWTVCKQLEWGEIPCIISDGDTSTAKKFELLNSNSMSITDNQMMEIIAGGGTVPEKYMKPITEIIGLVGEDYFKQIAKKNVSVKILGATKRLGLYLGNYQDREFLSKILVWMADHKQIFISRKAYEVNYSPKKIISAIEENKPLDIVDIMNKWNKKYKLLSIPKATKTIEPVEPNN